MKRNLDKKLFSQNGSKMNFVDEENKFQGNFGGNNRKYNDFSNNGDKYKRIKLVTIVERSGILSVIVGTRRNI